MTNDSVNTIALIDARNPACSVKIFSISLLERNLRLLALQGIQKAFVLTNENSQVNFRPDFGKFKPIAVDICRVTKPLMKFLSEREDFKNKDLLLMEGHAVYQETLIHDAAVADRDLLFVNSEKPMPALIRISQKLWSGIQQSSDDLKGLVTEIAAKAESVDISRKLIYMRNLRKSIQPYAFTVNDNREAKAAEKFLFEITHYGAIDVVAKYFYKALSKILVGWFAKTPVTPNQITLTSIVFAFSVSPVFALGFLSWGILLALVVSILDVCDGKLARFTYRTSEKGDLLDHVADRLNIYLYYIGYGVGLKMAGYVAEWETAGLLIAGVVAGHILDKVAARTFRHFHNIRIHDFSPLDGYARLFLPRRNIFIYMMLTGLLVGDPVLLYIVYAVWMYLYVLFHFGRVIIEKPKKKMSAVKEKS